MCLAVPAEVVELRNGDMALVRVGGIKQEISLMLVEGIEVGDYVLVHAGFAIEKVDREEAERTRELLQELARLEGESEVR